MKKGIKFVLILAAVLAVAGIGLTIGGFAAGAAHELANAEREGHSTFLHGLMERGYFNHGFFKYSFSNGTATETYEVTDDLNSLQSANANATESAFDSDTVQSYTGKGTYQTFIGTEDINEIIVETDEADVFVYPADKAKNMPDNNTILVEISVNDERESCYVDTDNNQLYIREYYEESYSVFSNDHSHKSAKIKLYLPEEISYSFFTIDSGAGDVTLESDLICESFSIDLDAGDLKAEHEISVSGDADIFCDAGDAEIKNIICGGSLTITMSVGELELYCDVTGDLNAQCDVGDMEIHMSGSMEDYNYDISVDAGDLYMDGAEHGNGFGIGKDIQLTNNPSGSTIVLRCNVGDVELEFDE